GRGRRPAAGELSLRSLLDDMPRRPPAAPDRPRRARIVRRPPDSAPCVALPAGFLAVEGLDAGLPDEIELAAAGDGTHASVALRIRVPVEPALELPAQPGGAIPPVPLPGVPDPLVVEQVDPLPRVVDEVEQLVRAVGVA